MGFRYLNFISSLNIAAQWKQHGIGRYAPVKGDTRDEEYEWVKESDGL